jgi:hypothetical protein
MLVDRYIIPTITLSWPILLTFLISRIMPDRYIETSEHTSTVIGLRAFSPRTIALAPVTLILLIQPVKDATISEYSQKPGSTDRNYGYPDLPIALEAGHDFFPRFYYSDKPSRYFHILDWETAVNNVTSVFATGDYVFLNAISRHYPFIQSVQSTAFLEKYDRFLVLNEGDDNLGRGKWFEARIKDNPNYQVKRLGTQQGTWGPLEVFLVERKSQMSN